LFLNVLLVSLLKFFRLSPLIWFGFCNHCNLACFCWSINFEHSSSNRGGGGGGSNQCSGTWRNSIHILASQYNFAIDGVFSVFNCINELPNNDGQ
jgi:hypothetical protein